MCELKLRRRWDNMNVRKATSADIEAIYELGRAVDEFTVSDETVNFWPKELLANAVQSNDALILVAEDEGIIGFLIVNYNSSLKKALIENIYVQPDKRGQGIGDKLLEHMFKLLPDMGCEYVATLVPLDAQDALDLYQRNGLAEGETFVWLDKALASQYKKG